MKFVQLFSAALLVANFAQGAPHKPEIIREEVAPQIVSATISDIGEVGKVVKTNHAHPFSDFLIAIPAKVGTGSACRNFVGIETTHKAVGKNVPVLKALATTDPLVDACIDIFPLPVDTQLTVKMHILTGGFVPANDIQKQLVQIEGNGTYQITLDLSNESVKIDKVFTKQ